MGHCANGLVSVIIVTCNKKDMLSGLLFSLRRQGYRPIETIVVLNGCPEQECGGLSKNFPDTVFIHNKENLFFCKGQNQGIRTARGEFILGLNDDLILEEDFIEKMIEAARKNERIGMVSGCIMRQDKKTLDTTGLFLARSRKPLERGYGRRYKDRHKTAGYIFGSGGAAPLYRRKMLEDIKLGSEYFDENYHMFYEDLDISWRAQNRGWKGYYTPFALAYHLRGGTAGQNRPRLLFLQKYNFARLPGRLKSHLVKNRYMTIIKNDHLTHLLLNLPWVLGYEIKLWLYLILFEPAVVLRIFKERGFVKLAWEKRKQIQLNQQYCTVKR